MSSIITDERIEDKKAAFFKVPSRRTSQKPHHYRRCRIEIWRCAISGYETNVFEFSNNHPNAWHMMQHWGVWLKEETLPELRKMHQSPSSFLCPRRQRGWLLPWDQARVGRCIITPSVWLQLQVRQDSQPWPFLGHLLLGIRCQNWGYIQRDVHQNGIMKSSLWLRRHAMRRQPTWWWQWPLNLPAERFVGYPLQTSEPPTEDKLV